MKNINKWSVTNASKIFADGSTTLSIPKDTTRTYVVSSPVGMNPGNHKDPTSWGYTVINSRKFTGVKVEYYPIGKEHNRVVGCYGGEALPGATWERTSLYNAALSRLNAKARQNADWSEDIAKSRETARLANLADQAKQLVGPNTPCFAEWCTEPRPMREKDWKRLANRPAGQYLKFKFGFLPLMQNIFDTADALLQRADAGFVKISGSSSRKMNSSSRVTNPGSGSSSPYAVEHSESGKQGCRIVVTLRGSGGPSISDFTTLNPALLAWNLLPWSFVVDWFYNVGGYLEAWETAYLLNSRFVSGYIDELYAVRVNEIINDTPDGSYFKVLFGRAVYREIRFQRTKLVAYPLPNRPVFRTDLSSGHLLSAAALLGAFLK